MHNSRVVALNRLFWLTLLVLAGLYAAFLFYAKRAKLFAPRTPASLTDAVEASPAVATVPTPSAEQDLIEWSIRAWKQALALAREGATYADAGKAALAKQKLAEAVSLAPDLTIAREELARFLEREKNYAEAEREWRAVLARDPERVSARIRLAATYLAMGEHGSALETARWALEADPYEREALDIVATALIALHQPRAALDYLKRLAAIDRDNAGVKNRMGLAYLSLDDTKNAAAMFGDVLRTDPANSVAAYNLAVLHARNGAAVEAVDILREAARRHGGAFVLAWTRGKEFDPIREHPAFRAFAEPLSDPATQPSTTPSDDQPPASNGG